MNKVGNERVIFKIIENKLFIILQDRQKQKQTLEINSKFVSNINQLLDPQQFKYIAQLSQSTIFGGSEQDMISEFYYQTPPLKGNFFITSDQQLFVLINENYQQSTNWIQLNKQQPQQKLDFLYAFITSDINENITENYTMQFSEFVTSDIQEQDKYIQVIDNNIFIKTGVYKFEISSNIKYQDSTNYPIKYKIVGDAQGLFQGTYIETDTTQSFQSSKITSTNHIIKILQDQFIYLQFETHPQYIHSIQQGTQLIIQQLQ